MQVTVDFLAGDFRREMPQRRIRHLIFGIMERACGHVLRQRTAQVINAVAGHRGNHEGLIEGQTLVGLQRQRQQLLARHQIDLVQHKNLRVIDGRKLGQDRVGFVVDARTGVEQHADEVRVVRPAPRGRHHGAVEPPLGREDARRIDENNLRVILDHDAADQRARGLHLLRDDSDLRSDQRIDQRRLADVRRTDQRDEAAARFAS